MTTAHQHRTGLLLGLAAFALMSCGDAVVKTMAGQWPVAAVVTLRFAVAAVVLGTILLVREGRGIWAVPRPGAQLLRGGGLSLGSLAFFSAIYVMPLATATTITFVAPILTALLSAIILREPATRTTWLAAIIAFAGVVLILQPDVRQFDFAMLLPLLAALGTALTMIGNRMAAGTGSVLRMQFLLAVFTLPPLMCAMLIGHGFGPPDLRVSVPELSVVARTLLVAASATTSHWLLYLAVARAGANAVAPMSYGQALVTLAIGIAVFGDWPNLLALVGAAIVIAAGLWQLRSTPAPGQGASGQAG